MVAIGPLAGLATLSNVASAPVHKGQLAGLLVAPAGGSLCFVNLLVWWRAIFVCRHSLDGTSRSLSLLVTHSLLELLAEMQFLFHANIIAPLNLGRPGFWNVGVVVVVVVVGAVAASVSASGV